MERMSLKDIQNVSLEILKDVHDFCVNNNIRYSLAYGTLIGAVRHQGFIPWDDDIDIFMPRPDYERFCKLYKSGTYKLISSYDKDSYLAFSRVCEMEKTMVVEFVPWANQDTGVWIDIFPLDGAEENKQEFDARYIEARKLWRLVYMNRGARKSFSSGLTLVQIAKLIVKKVLWANGVFLKKNLHKFNNIIQKYRFEECKHWGQMTCCDNGTDEYNLTAAFDDIVLANFEQYEFCIIKDYDAVLKSQYNDYMQLPPIEKRIPKQSDIVFYWK